MALVFGGFVRTKLYPVLVIQEIDSCGVRKWFHRKSGKSRQKMTYRPRGLDFLRRSLIKIQVSLKKCKRKNQNWQDFNKINRFINSSA